MISDGFKAAKATFKKAGLPLPPVPVEFIAGLKEIGPWCFATRRVTGMDMYFFQRYLTEVLTRRVPAYVAFSHAGHGINSYSVNYHLVVDSLALFAQVGWGGVYDPPSTKPVQRLFARCAALIAAVEQLREHGAPRGHLVVFESDFRGTSTCGWLERPLKSPAEMKAWMRTHSTAFDPRRRSLPPTTTARRWVERECRRVHTAEEDGTK